MGERSSFLVRRARTFTRLKQAPISSTGIDPIGGGAERDAAVYKGAMLI